MGEALISFKQPGSTARRFEAGTTRWVVCEAEGVRSRCKVAKMLLRTRGRETNVVSTACVSGSKRCVARPARHEIIASKEGGDGAFVYWVVKWEGVWKRYETRGWMGWDLSFTSWRVSDWRDALGRTALPEPG